MDSKNLMEIYDHLPLWGQNIACTLEGFRVKNNKSGIRQKRKLKAFMKRNSWTYTEKCKYRDQQLQEMVKHCYFHVPYYRTLFDKLKIDYREIRCLEDLQRIPILTKQIVRDNFDLFFADNVKKSDLLFMHTSGTTGSGFQFYYTKDAYAAQWADVERYKRNIGMTGKEWAAYFGGRSIVPNNNPPFYRINYAMKEIMFSSFHLLPKNFPNYIEGLEKKKLEMWHGYPSSFLPLAQYLIDNNIHLSYTPKWILLSSENVTDLELNKMEQAFGVRPLQGYAMTEQVATFWQYRNGRMFVIEDLSAVEFVPEISGGYRVIGTTLTNYAMPFLRYDTKDIVDYRELVEGREIISIEGRVEDNIKLRNGGVIRRLDFIFKDQVNIAEAQIVQRSLDSVEFRVVRGKGYSQEDENALKHEISAYLSGKIDYTIVYVDRIQKSKNGKMKFIVSEI